jgi:putative endonuclease
LKEPFAAAYNLYLNMAKHNHTGLEGETLGTAYLQAGGYLVLEKNWRHSHWEVDIIASKNDTLHFIEIKTRRTKKFGLPEEKVGRKKIENLINAAEQYLYLQPQWKRIQFDILSILILNNQPVNYFFIEDVYL